MLEPLFPTGGAADTPELRKARGAFFTPQLISRFVADWAIRGAAERVLEPSAGDASFLVEAVRRLRTLDSPAKSEPPTVDGVEIHAGSASQAAERVRVAGGVPQIEVADFFTVDPRADFDAVIGNPPFIRYQDFAGTSRQRSREAALKAGVSLTALASSWAAFVVHSALFLRPGGRLGLVVPAELLSVNYAAVVRRFLLERFRSVELVLFEEQVFPEAEADVLLLLADGFQEGPAAHATIYQTRNAESLHRLGAPLTWTPPDPGGKWTGLLLNPSADASTRALTAAGDFCELQTWGDTTLGMVTGNNRYFALSPQRAAELGIPRRELLSLSPPGSAHLRGLDLTASHLGQLGRKGASRWLFRPDADRPSQAALAYIDAGHRAGVDQAYKCRVRAPWWRVPLVPPADLFLTCMNADTPRLTTNAAAAHHLNSVHGVYLQPEHREIGRELLPLASLNSVTLLSAEVVGRSYGGGILKLEPREADVWSVPSSRLVTAAAPRLRKVRPAVARALGRGELAEAVELVDRILFESPRRLASDELRQVREARASMAERRSARGRSGR